MSDSKAIKVFKKLKQKGKFIVRSGKENPRLSEQDDEPNFAKLNWDAVKFLHFFPEVERREYDYNFVGRKGLYPDYYQGV